MVLHQDMRVGTDAPGDFGAQDVCDFLRLGFRAVDADEAGRIASAGGQTLGLVPAVAESDESIDV